MTTTAPLTLDEFLRLPEDTPASEYVGGEVLVRPMPTLAHIILQRYFVNLLMSFFGPDRGGAAYAEWRCIFGRVGDQRALVPDVAVILGERVPHGDARRVPYFRGAPDLVIEVLSPDQPARQFADKLLFYLRHGVRLVWVVDAEAEVVSVYAPDAEPLTLAKDGVLTGGEVLPGFSLALSELFAQLQV